MTPEETKGGAGDRSEPAIRSSQGVLLVMRHVFDPVQCRVLRLPNPFEARAGEFFRAEGQGIRYRYKLKS